MIPFEKLGPGQSGRLVYQVVGKDGPFFNPKNLAFLPPDVASDSVSSALPEISTALGGLNLMAATGNLAVSTAILGEVRKLSTKLDTALVHLQSVDTKIDKSLEKLTRIDARVAENNLRQSLDHILRLAISPTEIDFGQIRRIEGELEAFTESIEDWSVCGAPGLRLSADVHDRLSSLFALLFGVRSLAYQEHNKTVGGDPRRTITLDLMHQYLPAGSAEVALVAHEVRNSIIGTSVLLLADIQDRFMFAGEQDDAHYTEFLETKMLQSVMEQLVEVSPAGVITASILEETLNALTEADEKKEAIAEYRRYWLWSTASGLLWRVRWELCVLEEGYENYCGIDKNLLTQCAGTTITAACIVNDGAIGLNLK